MHHCVLLFWLWFIFVFLITLHTISHLDSPLYRRKSFLFFFTLSIFSKMSEVAMVAGASSMIFWCLRWTEQSLPNREMALPYWSARICTSRCRACLASRMTKMGDPGTSVCTYGGKKSLLLKPVLSYRSEYAILNRLITFLQLCNSVACSAILA